MQDAPEPGRRGQLRSHKGSHCRSTDNQRSKTHRNQAGRRRPGSCSIEEKLGFSIVEDGGMFFAVEDGRVVLSSGVLGSFENSYIPENPRTPQISYISQTVIPFKKPTSEPSKTGFETKQKTVHICTKKKFAHMQISLGHSKMLILATPTSPIEPSLQGYSMTGHILTHSAAGNHGRGRG
ncbi:hypothetical protein LXL04_007097 [Taraxacum kok-saghyz]